VIFGSMLISTNIAPWRMLLFRHGKGEPRLGVKEILRL
jgi:hypothetical protein